jgi:hypothetical protein
MLITRPQSKNGEKMFCQKPCGRTAGSWRLCIRGRMILNCNLPTSGPRHNITRQHKWTVYRIEKITRTSYKTATGYQNINQEARELRKIASPPLYLHEIPENLADQYYTVFIRQHKTYLNHGRGRYRNIFYEKLRSILCIHSTTFLCL